MKNIKVLIAIISIMIFSNSWLSAQVSSSNKVSNIVYVIEMSDIGSNNWRQQRELIEIRVDNNSSNRCFMDLNYNSTKEWFMVNSKGLHVYDDWGYVESYKRYNSQSSGSIIGVWVYPTGWGDSILWRIRKTTKKI